jgi:glycosyltransferase involved in cell wall biosynthesis
MKLTVVIPVYNEVKTLAEMVAIVQAVPVEKEIVLVDDYSTDGTRDKLPEIEAQYDNVRVAYHEVNQGKGAALRTGFQQALGDIVIIQDADDEYDPNEYPKLIAPIEQGLADVVYGSRYAPRESRKVLPYWHTKMNEGLTRLSNMCSDVSLTDMETCYKVFRREVIQGIAPDLEECRFGFEPEITAKLAAAGVQFYELPISYFPRSYDEGKKIGWRDGVRALWCILKYNARKKRYREQYKHLAKKD